MIREACIWEWILDEYITIDEMMACYKGTYCPACQYMHKSGG